MKRTIRFFSLLLLLLLALLCFSSCRRLDEMKEEYAYLEYNDVIRNGKKFLPVEGNGGDYTFASHKRMFLNVVPKDDVPVLLSEMFGDTGYGDKSERFLLLYNRLYVREDLAVGFRPEKELTGLFPEPKHDSYKYEHAYSLIKEDVENACCRANSSFPIPEEEFWNSAETITGKLSLVRGDETGTLFNCRSGYTVFILSDGEKIVLSPLGTDTPAYFAVSDEGDRALFLSLLEMLGDSARVYE